MAKNIDLGKCKNCGEIISVKDKFCSSCGAAIERKSAINEKSNLKEDKDFINHRNSISKKKNGNESEIKNFKRISFVKLFYLSFGLIIVALIIILSSGIFNEPTSSSNFTSNTENISSGVNLQNLERINNLENEISKKQDNKKLLELAHLLNDSGFKERAIEKYRQYLKTDPKNADVLVDMGVCYYELGMNKEAISFMKEALLYQPKHQIAHLNLGVVSLASQKLDEAKDWWRKAIEINPTSDIGKRAQELINSH